MQKLITNQQLIAVYKGFLTYSRQLFNEEKLICHPLIKGAIFLPDINTNGYLPTANIASTFLASGDLTRWFDCSLAELIDTVASGGNYFIADLKLNVYMQIHYHMLNELVEILSHTTPLDIYICSSLWKSSQLGMLREVSSLGVYQMLQNELRK